jgi:hypothetical protein
MKVQIAEVRVTKKTIELPDKCPGCKANLTKPGAFNVEEFMQYQWCGSSWNGKKIEWIENAPNAGTAELELNGDEHRTGWTRIECAKCEHVLSSTYALREEKEIMRDKPQKAPFVIAMLMLAKREKAHEPCGEIVTVLVPENFLLWKADKQKALASKVFDARAAETKEPLQKCGDVEWQDLLGTHWEDDKDLVAEFAMQDGHIRRVAHLNEGVRYAIHKEWH